MSELDDVLKALRAADQAGNTQDAKRLAEIAAQMQAGGYAPKKPSVTKAQQSQAGTIADSLGKGLSFGFADEIAGLTGAAVNSLMNKFGRGTGESFGDAYTGIRDIARMREEGFAERNPGTALAAEIGGGLLTGGVGAARAGAFQAAKSAPTLAGRLAPVVQTGAVQGGLYGAGASEAGDARGVAADTLKGAALGGATAPILPAMAGGARSAAQRVFRTNDTAAFNRAKQLLAEKAGITGLTTGQTTGSRALRAAEDTLSETIAGGRLDRQLAANRAKLQQKLMRMAGFDRSSQDYADGLITQDGIDAAADQFSRRYQQLLGNRQVDLATDEFTDALYDAAAKNSELLTPFQRKEIFTIADELFDMVTGSPKTASELNKIRSMLGQRERQFAASKPYLSDLYRGIKRAIDDGSFAAGGRGRKTSLDAKYRRFVQLRDTFESSGAIGTARGELPLSMLLRRSASAKGADREFTELVRAGQTVLGDPMANSTTASRLTNLAFLLGEGGAFMVEPSLAISALAAPNLMSRGVTGGQAVDRLIQGGLLTAPVVNPIFGQSE